MKHAHAGPWLPLAALLAAPCVALDLTPARFTDLHRDVFSGEDEESSLRAGPVDLRGAAAVSFGYDSNVDAVAEDVDDEGIATGLLLLRADNRSARLDFHAQAFLASYRYSESREYDTTESGAEAELTALLSPRDLLAFSLDAQRRFERRVEIETPTSIPVSLYDDLGASLRHTHTFNRLSTRVTLEGQRVQYSDATQEYRDHTLSGGELRATYELGSDVSGFASAGFRRDEFDSPSPSVASADTTSALLGVLVSNELVDLEFGAGYFERRFAAGGKMVDGLALNGAMTWRPTRLTTLRAEITRADEPTQVPGADFGKIRNEALLRITHDYSRSLTLFAGARLVIDEFESAGDDTMRLAELGANWQVGRHSMVNFTYDFGSRDTQSLRGFERRIASLSFIGRL